MLIWTCKKKQLLMITCMSNHMTNAKYMKYMHLGTILPRYKCEVLKTYWQYLKSTEKCHKGIEIDTNILNIKLNGINSKCTKVLNKK